MAGDKNIKDSLLGIEMDRKEFIAYTASMLLAVSGIGAIKKLLTSSPSSLKSAKKSGYGSSPYGK